MVIEWQFFGLFIQIKNAVLVQVHCVHLMVNKDYKIHNPSVVYLNFMYWHQLVSERNDSMFN